MAEVKVIKEEPKHIMFLRGTLRVAQVYLLSTIADAERANRLMRRKSFGRLSAKKRQRAVRRLRALKDSARSLDGRSKQIKAELAMANAMQETK